MCFVQKFVIFSTCDWIVRFIIDFLTSNKIIESFQNKALENGTKTSKTRETKSEDWKTRSTHICSLWDGGTDVWEMQDVYIANGISKSQRALLWSRLQLSKFTKFPIFHFEGKAYQINSPVLFLKKILFYYLCFIDLFCYFYLRLDR